MCIPVVNNVLVLIADQRLLVPSLQYMDAVLVDSQPQVLGQSGCVALQHVKNGGAIQRPLADEGHVGIIAVLL